MRYRKSIKICKGVKLNLSKSGISTTIGRRGFSVTSGSRGTYLNTGIPGTGIYDRHKISGGGARCGTHSSTHSGTHKASTYSIASGASHSQRFTLETFDLHMNDDGTITISHHGQPVLDDALLRKIKRTEAYKQEKIRLTTEFKGEMADRVAKHNEELENIIQIVRYSEPVPNVEQIKHDFEALAPQKYQKQEYSEPLPDEIEIKKKLEKESETAVATFAFWKVKKLREKYVQDHFPKRYAEAMDTWQAFKADFDEAENAHAEAMNAMYYHQYECEKEALSQFLAGGPDYIESALDGWLSDIELPLDFSVQYEYSPQTCTLSIDLDLPEIEDMPDEVASQATSGIMKIKKKSQQQIKESYVQCVFGFAVFIASHCFGVSAIIDRILISGYTQRRDKNGDITDDYVYSIVFDRGKCENTDLTAVDPFAFCVDNCQTRCNITKTSILKTIKPFEAQDI